ncbi:MAG: hypothetical protein GC202_10055 [Alphaproteobacteria bacterium]|nr:hypothetical protein [Alphaproteobacteria bacterium]
MRIFAIAGAAALVVGMMAFAPAPAQASSFGAGTAVSSLARDHGSAAVTQVADKKKPVAKKKPAAKKIKKP